MYGALPRFFMEVCMSNKQNKPVTGQISIDAQNIMPVIKRWLYSDKDIFIRELVSNGVDAITKLNMLGKGEGEDLKVQVTLDKKKKTITFEDNGVGMTQDEVERYINQVAFSSAEEFLKNYAGEAEGGIIGHFGLGFYSAFMAAEKVVIDTLSHQEGAQAVRWESEDGINYEMSPGDWETRGTAITLHIMKDEEEFLEGFRVREVLEKYCGYMSVPVYFTDVEGDKEDEKAREKRNKEGLKEAKKEGKEAEFTPEEAPAIKPINDISPIWFKNAKDVTDEEYKETYRKLFHTWEDPLFWIHLNVDYPFNLKGILYFPRLKRDFAGQEGEIKLFNRQVFVADNIKEIIPEFLMVLKGVIDCPDLPLNVSRSFLQNDGQVRKISGHIAKKVADKLLGLFKTERETYQGYWDDIHPFIKYGCVRDRKFYDAVKDALLLKTTEGEYYTFDEYKARNEGKAEKKVYYTSDPARQAAGVALFTSRGIDVAVMDTLIDINFMSFMEYSGDSGDKAVQFMRVDADVTGLKEDSEEGKDLQQEDLQKLFRDALGSQELEVKLEALADKDLAAMLTEDEQMRRFKDMSALYGQSMAMPDKHTLVLNRQNPVIRALAAMEEGDRSKLLCQQVYDLARLSAQPLEADSLKEFLKRSNQIVALLAEKE